MSIDNVTPIYRYLFVQFTTLYMFSIVLLRQKWKSAHYTTHKHTNNTYEPKMTKIHLQHYKKNIFEKKHEFKNTNI